jgi:hypothetical protein
MSATNTPHAVSKVRQNRRARYAAWAAMTKAARIAAGVVTVYTHDRSEAGYAVGYGRPYTGEAGYSRTLRVHWGDEITHCAIKGMVPAVEVPSLPGGFSEWTIR